MTIKKTSRPESKTDEVCRQLRALAYEKGSGAQMPTVRALCERFNTTYVTLGEALDQLEAEQILYRKLRQGIFVSPQLHHTCIHILFDTSCLLFETHLSRESMSPFWNLLWARLEHEISKRAAYKDETCLLHLVKSTPEKSLNDFAQELRSCLPQERLHGVLAINIALLPEEFLDPTLPYVSFAGPGKWIVQLDGAAIGAQATTTLSKQGCKKIGLWLPGNVRQTLESFNEVAGVRQALAEQHLPFYPELIRQLVLPPTSSQKPGSLSHQEQGYLLAHEVFGLAPQYWPDGLFIADDLLTDGALVALDELGLRVAKDIHIVTHANIGSPILFGRTKHMTVFEYDPDDVIKAMFSVLDRLVAKQEPDQAVTWIRAHQRFQQKEYLS